MKRNVLPTVVTVIAAILGAALAVWGGIAFCTQITIGGTRPELYVLIPVYIILILLCAFLDEIVHEGAHFIVGACCGMGVKAPKIRIFKSSSVEMYPKGVKAMRLRFILTAAAGLFFDLLIIALGLIALLVPTVPVLFAAGLPYAFYSFVVNVVPLEYGAGKTDGLMTWEALRNTPSAEVMFAVLKVQGKVNSGYLLREVDESLLLDVPQIQEDDVNFIMLTQLRCEYYEAVGNDSEAYKYFLRYKDLIRYLPSEYTKGKQREEYSAEEIAEAQVKPGQLAKKPKEGEAEPEPETETVNGQPEQPVPQQAEPAPEQPAPEENKEENKEE